MSIVTKTGDLGQTRLFSGKRVWKFEEKIEILGEIDELSSFIGLVFAKIKLKREKETLTLIQRNLYLIMAYISGKELSLIEVKKTLILIEERIIQEEKEMKTLNKFILPQGDEISSWFHILRAICRRVERRYTQHFFYQKEKSDQLKTIMKFLNRLSDYFYILARKFNKKQEILA